MPRFIVTETQVVQVTWTREIEAPTAEMAIEAVKHPEIERSDCREFFSPETEHPVIGDSIDGYEAIYEVEELGADECL